MARKSAPAAESNTGLIVTLIFFVLATLVLGVFTYLGYSGQTELLAKEKDAQSKAKSAETNMNLEAMRRLVYQIATGNGATQDELTRLGSVKTANQAEFDKLVAGLKSLSKWDSATARPLTTYADQFDKMSKDLQSAQSDKKLAETKLAEFEKALAAERTSFNDTQAKAKANLEETQNKALADLKGAQDAYANLITKLDKELSMGLANEKQGRADDLSAADREKAKLVAELKSKKEQLDNAVAKLPQANSLEADTPKGSVLKIDKVAKTVFINLGSSDYLKPQVTFSIWGAGTSGRTAANLEPKGRIEVISVLEPHLSIARIVSTSNELRDPILPGDLIFNPSWNSSQREHVALAGIFDLDGDGNDDTPELIRNLERQGVVVDSWYDLRQRSQKGPGITERTSYLVLGEVPALPESLSRQVSQQGENAIVQAFNQINLGLSKMRDSAQQKGVQLVAYRRYLALVGYPLPKLTRPLDLTATTYIRTSTAAVAGAESGAKNGENKSERPKDEKPKAKPKEEKPKEDMPKEE